LNTVRLKIVVSPRPVRPDGEFVTTGSVMRKILGCPNPSQGIAERNTTWLTVPPASWRLAVYQSFSWNDISEAVGSVAFAASSSSDGCAAAGKANNAAITAAATSRTCCNRRSPMGV
jgi:hypothetical protein